MSSIQHGYRYAKEAPLGALQIAATEMLREALTKERLKKFTLIKP
jgi:hypothetical protein